jgi:cytochrome c oxidase cbb3-type subunit 3
MMICRWAVCFLVVAGIFAGQAQQQSPSAGDQPSTPPAPAGDQAVPVPNAASQNQQPGPNQQPDQQPGPQSSHPPDAVREAIRSFLAIGAPPDKAAEKRGQTLFVSMCGFCHGTNATGGAQGANLVRSTLVLHDQGTGKELAPAVRRGRPDKGMPAFPSFTDDQIHDVAQFLLGRTQAAANRMEYTIQNIVTGDPKTGQAYFQGHCAECHSATGDLAHIAGKYDPVALEGRILYPGNSDRFGMGPPPDPRAQKKVTVTLPSGESYSGVLAHIDDFSVALRESSGVYRSWIYDDAKGISVELHDPLAQHLTLLHHYTDADMHNVLAYLETLK